MVRWKAMGYMTISYIPWIIYWTLSAFLIKAAPVCSLLFTTILLIMQAVKKSFSFMDCIMCIYSIVAIFFNYFTELEFFLIGDGYMGYGALCIMGTISILIKHPFTRYYIQKAESDIPEDSSVHLSTSLIWTGVFIASVFIFICIDIPVKAIVFSNIFVVFGIGSSIFLISREKKQLYEA